MKGLVGATGSKNSSPSFCNSISFTIICIVMPVIIYVDVKRQPPPPALYTSIVSRIVIEIVSNHAGLLKGNEMLSTLNHTPLQHGYRSLRDNIVSFHDDLHVRFHFALRQPLGDVEHMEQRPSATQPQTRGQYNNRLYRVESISLFHFSILDWNSQFL